MPQWVLPLIGILVGAGSTAYGAVSSSEQADASKQAQQQALQQQQQQQQQAAQQQALANQRAISASLPNAQVQTSGYLTDLGTLGLAGSQAGVPTATTSGSGMQALLGMLGQAPQGSMAGLMNLGQSGAISGGSEG